MAPLRVLLIVSVGVPFFVDTLHWSAAATGPCQCTPRPDHGTVEAAYGGLHQQLGILSKSNGS